MRIDFNFWLNIFRPSLSTYKQLVRDHTDAFKRWRESQPKEVLSKSFDSNPTYADMKYIADHKEEILSIEKIIIKEKEFSFHRQQVIDAAYRYPSAFKALVEKLSIHFISDLPQTNSVEDKSKNSIRCERAKMFFAMVKGADFRYIL